MRYFILFSLLTLAYTTASAQSITISPLTKTTYCVGDPLTVAYQASGTFEYNNSFFVQLSDSTGSFKTFNSQGRSISGNGSITFTVNNPGEHYRVRVASGAPYVYSTDNGEDIIVGYCADVTLHEQPPIVINQMGAHLLALSASQSIELRLTNLLGNEVLSQRGTGELDVDLSSLPNGFFFAVLQAGEERIVKRIAVVH